MTQPLGVSNARSSLTQSNSCTHFVHTAPRLPSTIVSSSFGFKQSSLACKGRKPTSRWWVGWECKRAERVRGFKGQAGGVPSIGQDQFEEEVLRSELPVLVDFWAEWCGPCKLVAPVVSWAAKNYDGRLKVYKIETDANPDLVERFKPYGLPTLILFKDGKEVPGSRKEGAITITKLQAHLDNLLPALSTT